MGSWSTSQSLSAPPDLAYRQGMAIPGKLVEIIGLFASVPRDVKLQALLDYSRRLPPLPPELASSDRFERVVECQSPLFLHAELQEDGEVRLYFDAPQEAPTTRGFASILAEGLAGATANEILALPDDFYMELGLESVVSPLRMRGMGAMVFRIKRQISRQLGIES
jgi:cysteine desulfuration protein SufE